MIANTPANWDLETDFLSIGSGIGGLAGAITAHEQGLEAMVLERSDKAGGVTALSLGEVWVPGNHHAAERGIEDSPESGWRYVSRLSMGYAEDRLIRNQAVHAPVALRYFENTIGLQMEVIDGMPDYYYGHNNDAVSEGRLLEPKPFLAEQLGDWQERTRVSPQVPYGMTHEDMARGGGTCNVMHWDYALMGERLQRDERCLGPALAAYFVKGTLDRDIPILTETNVVELIGDGERVVGIRAEREGRDFFVRARKGVLLGVSSYDRSPNLVRTLSMQLEPGSMVFNTIDGAHFRLAGPTGARVARIPDVTMLGYTIPGEEMDDGSQMWRGGMTLVGLPHVIVVNGAGKRFGNEAFYRSLYFNVDAIDGGSQTHPNFPCWAIMDAQAREKYPIGSIMPGQEPPEEVAVKADTLAELAAKVGIDREGLAATVAAFNEACDRGEDPEFGRHTYPWSEWMCGDPNNKPHPNLGRLEKGPFYALPFKRLTGSAIASTGIVVDEHCRAVDWSGNTIPGLYMAGNSVARLDIGAVMQSGMSNARGMTHGYLSARHAAGNPSDLLEKAGA